MKNLGEILQQAQKMQEQAAEIQTRLESAEIEGSSGGGMVRVVLSGKGDLRAITIDPAVANPDEVDILEDLIVAAVAEAKSQVEKHAAEEMKALTGGIDLPPGFNFPA